jgi:hypothetical protein
MAKNRCFDSFNKNISASERSSEKRNTTIYNELYKNIDQLDTANPTKSNGYKYNKNSSITQCNIHSGKVDTSISYDIKTSIEQGAELIYPQIISTPKYENWCGNLYSVDYSRHDVNNVVQADPSFSDIIIDPSYILFYNECDLYYKNINKPEQWTSVVDLNFQDTVYAKQANNTFTNCKTSI